MDLFALAQLTTSFVGHFVIFDPSKHRVTPPSPLLRADSIRILAHMGRLKPRILVRIS